MIEPPSPSPHERLPEDSGDAMIGLALRILAAYLAVTAVPVIRWSHATGSWWPLVAHLAALCLAIACAVDTRRTTRAFRDWTPLLLGPFLYLELRWVVAGTGRPHLDHLVRGWEAQLFASDPSSTLALGWHSLALSELLHLCYVSYYALVYLPPALLWLRGRHPAFASTVLALVVVYALCFATYALFPVDGPRFLHGPSLAPSGPVRAFVVRLLESGSSRGTAFPSSHVAASLVAALCALRFQPRVGAVVATLAVGLAIGAVYGGYHYAIDVVAGVVTGGIAYAVALGLERRLTAPEAAPR
jgi:membrane-associated phospholipid phosphatase